LKILIIGYGSIGRKHYEALSKFNEVLQIDIVTKQKIENTTTFSSLETVKNIESYNYIVIASETFKHFQQLKYLVKKINNQTIFCEKPLFDKNKNLNIGNNNVFVGYVLRFHPLLIKLKEFLETENVISINVFVGQYLPTWRKNIDYRDSYSSKQSEGGGVLRDLSHEIDYVQWLVGELEEIKSYQLKISDLEIETDDYTTLIGKTIKGTAVNISMDYISKILKRNILIHTFENSYELDFIKNNLIKVSKDGVKEVFSDNDLKIDINYMLKNMHKDIIYNLNTNASSFAEAISVMEIIDKIEKENS
jgi:predicted dehydrogenase